MTKPVEEMTFEEREAENLRVVRKAFEDCKARAASLAMQRAAATEQSADDTIVIRKTRPAQSTAG